MQLVPEFRRPEPTRSSEEQLNGNLLRAKRIIACSYNTTSEFLSQANKWNIFILRNQILYTVFVCSFIHIIYDAFLLADETGLTCSISEVFKQNVVKKGQGKKPRLRLREDNRKTLKMGAKAFHTYFLLYTWLQATLETKPIIAE
jgi:hypothetical protein